jgi:hypothetical protein
VLPEEAAERLLDLAAGKAVPTPVPPRDVAPLEHPDAQRRFHTVTTHGELQAALDAPWDRWRVFLHPDQRELVSKPLSGPARVTGGAGTGKTVVAPPRGLPGQQLSKQPGPPHYLLQSARRPTRA